MAEDPRLDRIEKSIDKFGDKLDELTKVVTDLARIEERMITLFKRMDQYDRKHDLLDGRLTTVEEDTTQRGVMDRILDKALWLILGAGLAYIVKIFGEQP
jgi:hypothetical protein